MRIVIITQDDPFYLAENLDYLFSNLPAGTNVIGCVVTKVSPFGKKESFFSKAKRTLGIFGLHFFIRYAMAYARSKLPTQPTIRKVLFKHAIPEIHISGSLNSEASLLTIGEFSPDLLISIAGNEIFKRPFIDLAPLGCLNLHTALLPKYRGLMPSFWVLKNREKETGVSVFYVDEGIDSGPILVQKTIAIENMNQRDLIKATKFLGMQAVTQAIEKIRDQDTATQPNDDSAATYFHFPTRSDVKDFLRAGGKFF